MFQDTGARMENKECFKSNMAARDAIDDEIIFQREIQKKYIGHVHDQTGSMMPVFIQYEVDGTKSKNSGSGFSMPQACGVMEIFLHTKMQIKILL